MKTARSWWEPLTALAALAVVSAAAAYSVWQHGWTLYFGDAEAHLNIARRIVDARTPGYEQIGTVWLPLPHWLMLPLVGRDDLWRSGLAGTIPSTICFVVAGGFLFAAARRALRSSAAAWLALGLFALNPNLLYLQSAPMTESILFAGLMGMLYATVVFAETQSWWAVVGAAVASLAASLTRYEGWFVIPFVALFFLFKAKRKSTALVFAVLASLGPLYWLAHNWWSYGNVLEFYNGPYSAKAIYQRALDHRVPPYPGDHDWAKASLYFSAAVQLCCGWGPVVLGAAGVVAALTRKIFWPVVFLLLAPVFYIASMHSGGTPIYIPTMWPFSYYNTRYALSALPLLALCGGAAVLLVPVKRRALATCVLLVAATAPALFQTPISWKESEVNSVARRAWTEEAAAFLKSEYRPGDGIFTALGDLAGIYRVAGIPLRETLNEGNRPAWLPTARQPLLLLHEEWAVAVAGDEVSHATDRLLIQRGAKYELVKSITVKDAPVIQIFRRSDPPPALVDEEEEEEPVP